MGVREGRREGGREIERDSARERTMERESEKAKREFTAVYPYRSSLATLASPRQEWAESKTAN